MQSEVLNKIKNYREIELIANRLRKKNKKIVFTMGAYDLLHMGHILFLEQAKKFGDVLIVGIGTDKILKKLKGPGRPIYPEKLRAAMVAAIKFTDYVVILKEKMKNEKDDYSVCVSKIKPAVFVLIGEDSAKEETKIIAKKMGIKLKLVPRASLKISFISTTSTHKKIEELFKN